MDWIKNETQISSMRKGGKILHEALADARAFVRPGITTLELNQHIEDFIVSKGGYPGFKKVKGYSWGSCICINEQIVHTPPSQKIIRSGDVVTIDAGVYYGGMHTDSAITIQLGRKKSHIERFLNTGMNALSAAIQYAKEGNRIGHISRVFEQQISEAGYSIVRELTGHGIGKNLHEKPYIPCYLDKPVEHTELLKENMTLAVEVMYTMGSDGMENEAGGWSIKTKDNSIAACFEHTIVVRKNKPLILT